MKGKKYIFINLIFTERFSKKLAFQKFISKKYFSFQRWQKVCPQEVNSKNGFNLKRMITSRKFFNKIQLVLHLVLIAKTLVACQVKLTTAIVWPQ